VASKEIGLEVNADKTKYTVISRDQNAGQNNSMKIENSSFERVEEFKYLGTTLTNQNSIQEESKRRMKLGNVASILLGISAGEIPKRILTTFRTRRKFENYQVRECLLLFGAESFVFQFAIQNSRDQDT
jgi:hypothetical protein